MVSESGCLREVGTVRLALAPRVQLAVSRLAPVRAELRWGKPRAKSVVVICSHPNGHSSLDSPWCSSSSHLGWSWTWQTCGDESKGPHIMNCRDGCKFLRINQCSQLIHKASTSGHDIKHRSCSFNSQNQKAAQLIVSARLIFCGTRLKDCEPHVPWWKVGYIHNISMGDGGTTILGRMTIPHPDAILKIALIDSPRSLKGNGNANQAVKAVELRLTTGSVAWTR